MVEARMKRMTVTPATLAEIERSVDWQRVRAATDADIARQNAADPDAATPLSDAEAMAIRVQSVRKTTGWSQSRFAERFRIPLGTLRDWEQGRREPDAAALAYLRVIERNSHAVLEALESDAA